MFAFKVARLSKFHAMRGSAVVLPLGERLRVRSAESRSSSQILKTLAP